MFEPTIKYKKVNGEPISKPEDKPIERQRDTTSKIEEKGQEENDNNKQVVPEYTFEEEEDTGAIQIDPNDKDRIIITLSTGKKYSADRYCPHAGADLSYHGKLGENDYPPEIGPIVMCQFHYWEFALERNGDGFGGRATINACPLEETCSSKKLDW
ncbi:hypothetical protein G6F70_009255 [Rhizopus microsporus]|uniref:Rieske domain-containing protein n=2 Tax=Rhizopus TaxID=4842 RepID=A0A367J9P7_RHIAZ|nr:hypothetical protein G6F71_009250 [Rhizopus microsporus]RCH86684.1 hypothetical protein CU097_003904 [Rhizopus azygosporus]KAG1192019.1 hypothetical protein G6F70_009255 [Rhizopus microsporus]KAG1205833.1 hypothetical protein G6F69_009238 [Rhizopus microsporus]KAG1225618.1 hypothetical protein G6F67_009254 [Rhizopus microsporus]